VKPITRTPAVSLPHVRGRRRRRIFTVIRHRAAQASDAAAPGRYGASVSPSPDETPHDRTPAAKPDAAPARDDAPAAKPDAPASERSRARQARREQPPQGMVPARERRRTKVERAFMRLVATGGIVGIAVALGAILVGQAVAGWIVGLVIGLTSVILAAMLWSSRQL
jgi:hypothetical protein